MRQNPLLVPEEHNIALVYLDQKEYLTGRMYRVLKKKGNPLRNFYVVAVDTTETDPSRAVKGSIFIQLDEGLPMVGGASVATSGLGPWLYWGALWVLHADGEELRSDNMEVDMTPQALRVWDRLVADGWAEKMSVNYVGYWRGDHHMASVIDNLFTAGWQWLQERKEDNEHYGASLSRAADTLFTEKWKEVKLTANKKSDEEVYKEWKKLINMTPREIEKFLDEYGHTAGLSRSEAKAQGIKSGRDSARAIIRMKRKGKSNWNASDWEWARRQVNFVKRMSGARGALHKANGEPTRKYLSLLVWGHDPLKT